MRHETTSLGASFARSGGARLLALGGALAGIALAAPAVLRPALEWTRADRSRAGVRPLAMRELVWTLAAPGGIEATLRAEELDLAPRRVGPFALNLARAPRLRTVELELRAPDGDAWRVRGPAAVWEEDRLSFEGGCVLEGTGGTELHATRVTWRRGGAVLDVERPASARRIALVAGGPSEDDLDGAGRGAQEPSIPSRRASR